MKFSIFTPVHLWNKYRLDKFPKCIESVNKLDYDKDKIEHIIINDGSTEEFNVPDYKHIKVINKIHEERVIAYNAGFEIATGDVFVFVDSDDELEVDALGIIEQAYTDFPEYKMFNFGCTFIHKEGTETKRGPFKPMEKEVGHEVFGGGNIVNGTFPFSREIYDDLGGFPPAHIKDVDCTEINYGGVRDLFMGTPYDFSAAAQLEFPEIRQYFMVDHENEPNKIIKELGNPFGNDYYLFYKYTRKYKSKPIDKYILRVNLR